MEPNVEIKAEANLTEPIKQVTERVVLPPTAEVSKGITKLLSVVATFIDNVTYKYIANSEMKKKKFLEELEKKYNSIPEESLKEPNINILGNVMDSLKYNLDEDYLVEMYTNILISNMDSRTKNKCHICFVEILKQLSKNDLEVLKGIYMMKNISSIPFGKLNIVDSNDKPLNYELHNPIYIAKVDNYIINDYNAFSKSIENLNRFGLIEISYTKYFTDKSIYDSLIQKVLPTCTSILNDVRRDNPEATIGCEKAILTINNLGYDLMQICLRDNIQ